MSQTNNFNKNMPVRGILKQRAMEESLDEAAVQRSGPKRFCSFDIVEIREYRVIMDKPLSSEDILAALTVSWEPVSTDITTVQDYELTRSAYRRNQVRALDTTERISVLMSAGHKLEDICRKHAKVSGTASKCKPKSSKSKDAKHDLKSDKAAKTMLSRVRTAAKKIVKHNDSARKTLYNAAA